MPRHPFIGLIALALIVYGVYIALFIPPLVVGGREPVILACFAMQACAAFAAAIGVWRGSGWASTVTVILGVSIAVTQAVEAFGMGIIAVDRALIVTLAALAVTIALAVYVGRTRSLTRALVP